MVSTGLRFQTGASLDGSLFNKSQMHSFTQLILAPDFEGTTLRNGQSSRISDLLIRTTGQHGF